MIQHNEEQSYKVYMTDCMARIAHTDVRWYEILHPVDIDEEYQKTLDNFYSDFREKGVK